MRGGEGNRVFEICNDMSERRSEGSFLLSFCLSIVFGLIKERMSNCEYNLGLKVEQ